jgi:transmembrane sensor
LEAYKNYVLEDFIQDTRFRKWIIENDDETNAFWNEFLTRFPEKQPVILSARSMLNALQRLGEAPEVEQGERMWEMILRQTDTEAEWVEESARPKSVRYLWRWAAAASVALLCCTLGWYFFNQHTEKLATTYTGQVQQVSAKLIEQVNSTGSTRLVTLPDGSTIELAPNSRISYEEAFSGDQRKVFLSGEGFFDVVKNARKPFLVYANRLVVQVVGTSFTVISRAENAQASVVVKSGKVKVYTLESLLQSQGGPVADMVVLTPNMQARYDPAQNVISKSFIEEPAIINNPSNYPEFLFENTSASQVFETLEQSYGVSITYDEKTVENCSLTAPLGKEPLFRKLDIICQTIGATYQVWGTEIVISGPGCKIE